VQRHGALQRFGGTGGHGGDLQDWHQGVALAWREISTPGEDYKKLSQFQATSSCLLPLNFFM